MNVDGKMQTLLKRVLAEERLSSDVAEYRDRRFLVDDGLNVYIVPRDSFAAREVGISSCYRGSSFKTFDGVTPLIDITRAAYKSSATAYLRLDDIEVRLHKESIRKILPSENPVRTEYAPVKIGDESFDAMMKNVEAELLSLVKQYSAAILKEFDVPEKFYLLVDNKDFLEFGRYFDTRFPIDQARGIPIYLRNLTFSGNNDAVGRLFAKLDEVLW